MAVEKAVIFDDLMKGEEREGFRRGGQGRGQRGGMRGGRRGKAGGNQGRGQRGGMRGGRRGKSESQNRGSKDNQSNQGRSRKATTTTPQAVAKERAAIANVQGTKYSKQLSDAIRAANQRAFEKSLEGRKLAAAQANVTAAAQNPNLRAGTLAGDIATRAEVARMDTRRGNLLEKARRNQISTAELSSLADMNRAIGLNPTTGMGLVESARFQGQRLADDVPGLARGIGFLANPIASLATAALTGGRGIAGLIADRLGIGQDDEDSKPTIADVSNERPGFLSGIASALRLGEGSDFTTGPTIKRPFDLVRRGPGGGGGGGRPVTPRPGGFTPPPVTPRDPNAIPVIGKPVDNRMLNQYLALAGFTPQEIQLMPESFRFLD